VDQKNKAIRLIGLVILALALMVGWNYSLRIFSNTSALTPIEVPSTPAFDPTANMRFFETFPLTSSTELNKGLTIERIRLASLDGVPTPPPNYVSFLVLNHTEEAIIFDDIGFGVQIFQYEPASNKWTKVVLPYTPEKKQKILPPKTESFDYNVLNTWEFNDKDFRNIEANIIRIFITGVGASSNKNYGAYLDMALQK
jgi:hypothetical protein